MEHCEKSSSEKAQRVSFGSRLLEREEDLFTQNAWDHVELSVEMLERAQERIKTQEREKCRNPEVYDEKPNEFWNQFYRNNGSSFFKDRKWLSIEFPELFTPKDTSSSTSFTLAELGCGAGNTVFPFLQEMHLQNRKNVFAYACDYSSVAVNVVKSSPHYDESRMKALVYDLTSPDLPQGVEEGSVDICTCIFVLSAISPKDWRQAAKNLYRMLKPGGLVLFRDYGRYDLAQLRMKKDRLLDDNFYRRGDGTRVYFFTNQELEQDIFGACGFEVVQNDSDKRLLVNRKEQLQMYRCWQQGKFRKPVCKPTE